VNKDKWRFEYKVLSNENCLKFSKTVGIFLKMDVFPGKIFLFYAGFLMQSSLEVNLGAHLITTNKSRVIFFSLGFSLVLHENFSADTLGYFHF